MIIAILTFSGVIYGTEDFTTDKVGPQPASETEEDFVSFSPFQSPTNSLINFYHRYQRDCKISSSASKCFLWPWRMATPSVTAPIETPPSAAPSNLWRTAAVVCGVGAVAAVAVAAVQLD